MKKKSTPTFIIDHGKHRLAVWLRWNPFHFKLGIKPQGLYWLSGSRWSAFVAGFGFGMCTYMRRAYDR